MSILRLDAFSGIAGDMFVGALLDLGASFDVVRDGLVALDVEGFELSDTEVMRGPIRARKFEVRIDGAPADAPTSSEHDHSHPHTEHARGLPEIRAILEPAPLPDRVKTRALGAFEALAEAEAKVHGSDPETVHFHEVGAVDAICDIVGVALALEDLGVERIVVGPLRVGSGLVRCEHGTLPVPAPATLECLAGFDIEMDTARGELVTPTGACLLAALAEPDDGATLRIVRVGYGAGTRDPEGVPNVLRAVLCDSVASDDQPLVELRTNVDHLSPHVLAPALDRVRAAGAVEVHTVACTMKKGRSGHLVTALCVESARADVEAALFRETGTLGVRAVRVSRTILDREIETVATPWGEVRVKVGRYAGRVTSREPELEDCRALAETHGVPIASVVRAASRHEL